MSIKHQPRLFAQRAPDARRAVFGRRDEALFIWAEPHSQDRRGMAFQFGRLAIKAWSHADDPETRRVIG